jgi:hypothetical protein
MNPKGALSGNGNIKPSQDSPLTTTIKIKQLSIKQEEQLRNYSPHEVKVYALPINYII